MSGNCEFLAANLYAKSMFGESALANLSIEIGKNGFVLGLFFYFLHFFTFWFSGHIRIRAKSQGMAISLGDKINDSQKKTWWTRFQTISNLALHLFCSKWLQLRFTSDRQLFLHDFLSDLRKNDHLSSTFIFEFSILVNNTSDILSMKKAIFKYSYSTWTVVEKMAQNCLLRSVFLSY